MKKHVLIISLLFLSLPIYPQTFNVPKDYKLETKEDYVKYEQDVLHAFDWLMNNAPMEGGKRQEVNAFFVKWLIGTPTVSIGISADISAFSDCGTCSIIFMGGWAKKVIETKDNENPLAGNLAGIESLITYYKKYKSELGKQSKVEKYIKLQKKGKLENYIKERL